MTTFRGLHLESYEHAARVILHLATTDADEMLALRNSRHASVMFDALESLGEPVPITASESSVDGYIRASIDVLEAALVLAAQLEDRTIAPKRGALRRILKELAMTLR